MEKAQQKVEEKRKFKKFLLSVENIHSVESTGGVDDTAERAVKTQFDFHVVILTLSFNVFKHKFSYSAVFEFCLLKI